MSFLKIDEFKDCLQKYQMGTLSKKEEEKFEHELEKLDEYQLFLEAELGETMNENKILRRSQAIAYVRMGFVSLIISLLLLPTLNLLALVFSILS